jgi:hypothetical protein
VSRVTFSSEEDNRKTLEEKEIWLSLPETAAPAFIAFTSIF